MKPTRPLLMRLALAIGLAATTFAAGLYFGRGEHPAFTPEPPAEAVRQLLQLQLPTADGKPQPLAQWSGQVRVINYWATWCPPCREEMPEFSRLQQELGSKGVQFIGIALDSADSVQEFAAKQPTAYPLLIATPEAVGNLKNLGNSRGGLPFTLVLDRQGQARHVRLGGLNGAELAAILQPLL